MTEPGYHEHFTSLSTSFAGISDLEPFKTGLGMLSNELENYFTVYKLDIN